MSDEDARSRGELRGTSLRVYRYILKTGKPVRLNQIQKDLHLSGLSLAQYHAKKLVEMGLIKEGQEGYVVEKVVIENVFRFRNTLVPFQLAYSVFFAITLAALLVLATRNTSFSAFDLIAVSVNIAALTISLYQLRQTLRDTL